jgi:DNA polymerase
VKPRTPVAEALGYLQAIGFSDLYRAERPAGVASTRRESAAPQETGALRRDAASPPAIARSGESAAGLAEVAAEAAVCRACRLCETRNKVVFGSGQADARLMFIGEGPGADEDRKGLPFVGRAGELLTKIIQAIDLDREQVYIANIVKCRPPENREPAPDEVGACRGFLERQIDLVRPRLVVALGRVAAQSLLGNATPISRLRGSWYEFRGIPMMVTYHPAALLRNAALKRPTWEDMQRVRDRLLEL